HPPGPGIRAGRRRPLGQRRHFPPLRPAGAGGRHPRAWLRAGDRPGGGGRRRPLRRGGGRRRARGGLPREGRQRRRADQRRQLLPGRRGIRAPAGRRRRLVVRGAGAAAMERVRPGGRVRAHRGFHRHRRTGGLRPRSAPVPGRRGVSGVREPVVTVPPEAAGLVGGGPHRALFLDRDGVVNVDHGYVHTPGRTEWVPGIFELARAARAAGYVLVVATNQAGIARGYYDEEQFRAYTRWVHARFAEEGAPLLATYY